MSISKLPKKNILLTRVLLYVIVCTFWQGNPIFAEENSVTIVYKQKSQVLKKYYELLGSKQSSYKLRLETLDSINSSTPTIIVAVGIDAFNGLIKKRIKTPIIAVFVSRLSYRKATMAFKKHANVSAIYSDPNPRNQIKLAKLLYKKSIDVAVLLSKESEFLRPEITSAANRINTKVQFVNVEDSSNIYKILGQVNSYDVLLAIPDSLIYNRQSIRTIMLTTYRHDQSMIGFSRGMVNAGALATTNVEMPDLADETHRWVLHYLKTKNLPRPDYSRKFNIYVNEFVAESLNIYGDMKQITEELVSR